MKKKIYLIISLLVSGTMLFATDQYLYDFETEETSPKELVNAGWMYDEGFGIVDNPLKDEVNSSDKCLTFEAQDGIEWWGGPLLELEQTTTTATTRYLYMKVLAEDYISTKCQIGLFNGKNEEGGYVELDINLMATRETVFDIEWREFCFEIEPDVTFSEIRIQPAHWGTYYVDDIRLSDEAPVIPELQPFALDFETEDQETGWVKNSDEGDAYRAILEEDPFTNDPDGNVSEYCMRAWITNGTWDKYGGAKYTGVYGVTTEKTRYLHVRFFFLSNEDHEEYANLPLRVFTDNNDDPFESEISVKNRWHDVTIDLGVGTLVKYLAFNINAWWVTLGVDDIQLDWDPVKRADLTVAINPSVNSPISFNMTENGLSINGIEEKSLVSIYDMTGKLVKQMNVNEAVSFYMNKGLYIVKVEGNSNNLVQKVFIK